MNYLLVWLSKTAVRLPKTTRCQAATVVIKPCFDSHKSLCDKSLSAGKFQFSTAGFASGVKSLKIKDLPAEKNPTP